MPYRAEITQKKYKIRVMKTIKTMARTAKKSAKSAVIVPMAVLAANVAIADLKDEFKEDYIPMVRDGKVINYTWDPFDGMLA